MQYGDSDRFFTASADEFIPDQPLPTIIVDESTIQTDEYGSIWARSGNELVELFVLSEDEDEEDAIAEGYREVITEDDRHAQDYLGRSLYTLPL